MPFAALQRNSRFCRIPAKMVQREHGEKAPATLAEEKKFNPYLQATTLAGFMGME